MPAKRSRFLHPGAALAFAGAVAIGLLSRSSAPVTPGEPEVSPPAQLPPAEVHTWKAAALQVEERRGEPTGVAAAVSVPPELRHYAERRRFLAIQVAETQEQGVPLPPDEAALIRLIKDQQLVRMNVLGDDYILYGVGANATGEPFAHWDQRTGARVPLFENWADYKDAEQGLLAQVEARKAEATARRAELKRTSVRARTRRRQIRSQARAADAEAAGLESQRRRLASWYEDYDRRKLLVSEYHLVHDFAREFDGRAYDVEDPAQRRLMRARLFSYVRPPARDFILELARHYHQQFDRPLPVTSLVRTEAYQLQLGRTNPNATTIDSPPHATGLAFDVLYGHMAAAEQQAVMDELALAESQGRVEALRETRNHFHVFVFPDGQRPSERLITASLDEVHPAQAVARAGGGARRAVASSRLRTAASVKRAASRKTAVRQAPARTASVRKAPARKAPTRRTTARRPAARRR